MRSWKPFFMAMTIFISMTGGALAADEAVEIDFDNGGFGDRAAREAEREAERAEREQERAEREQERAEREQERDREREERQDRENSGPSDPQPFPAGGGFIPEPQPGPVDLPVDPPLGGEGPGSVGPNFPSPTGLPGGIPGDAGGGFMPTPSSDFVPSGLQPTTHNQAASNPMVSVYAQSSSSSWVLGDPFDTTPQTSAAETSLAPMSVSNSPSMVFFYTGTVVSKSGSSVTLKDRSRKIRTVIADPASVSSLRKGQEVRVGLVPGSNRALSLRAKR